MSNATSRTTRKPARRAPSVREGSGNVFADLDIAESREALAKAELAARIARTIAKLGLTQVRAAELLHVTQADVSDLVRGKLKGFSSERLIRFLNALGQDVAIVILEPRARRRTGTLRVLDAHPRRATTGTRSAR